MKLTRSEIDTIEHKIEAGTHDLDSQLQALKEKLFSLDIAKGIVSNFGSIFMFLFTESNICIFSPTPGHCATKDSLPVAEDMTWEGVCVDTRGFFSILIN